MNCPTIAGITFLNACGRTIRDKDMNVLRPSDFAASIWPLGTDARPPRIFSAM